jgi:hypothetical protein
LKKDSKKKYSNVPVVEKPASLIVIDRKSQIKSNIPNKLFTNLEKLFPEILSVSPVQSPV